MIEIDVMVDGAASPLGGRARSLPVVDGDGREDGDVRGGRSRHDAAGAADGVLPGHDAGADRRGSRTGQD